MLSEKIFLEWLATSDPEPVEKESNGAESGTRTHTPREERDFESRASTSFATSAAQFQKSQRILCIFLG